MKRVDELSTELGQKLMAKGYSVTTAESCTGGGIAQAITNIAGSSQWFSHGFVTYSNEAKQQLLGVTKTLLQEYGAVSQPVVEAMVMGALEMSRADIGVAVSGIAGPSGGGIEKPIGTVWIAWKLQGKLAESTCFTFSGDRKAVRNQAIYQSLLGLCKKLQNAV
jgi:nicotinamide-nucleotide amidase